MLTLTTYDFLANVLPNTRGCIKEKLYWSELNRQGRLYPRLLQQGERLTSTKNTVGAAGDFGKAADGKWLGGTWLVTRVWGFRLNWAQWANEGRPRKRELRGALQKFGQGGSPQLPP